jgi:hypothetical protein
MQRKSPTLSRPTTAKSSVLLERGRVLQHVASYEDTSDGEVLRYWLKMSGLDTVPLCCLCGAHKSTRGAHMFGIRLPSVVVVPACSLCDISNVSLSLPTNPNKSLFDLKCRPLITPAIGVFATADILDRIDSNQRREAATELASIQRHQESIRRQVASADLEETAGFDQERAATPMPPSPVTDPEVIVLDPAPLKKKLPPPPPPLRTAPESKENTKVVKGASSIPEVQPKSVDFSDATPRPSRRRSEAQTPKQFQQVGGCKTCNAPVCHYLKSCPGKSKTFCCEHCKCRGNQRGVGSQDACRRRPSTAAAVE